MPRNLLPDIEFHSVSFGPEWIEVSFLEAGDKNEHGVRLQTFLINPDDAPRELEEFIDALVELLEAGLVAWRQPAETIPSARRARVATQAKPDESYRDGPPYGTEGE